MKWPMLVPGAIGCWLGVMGLGAVIIAHLELPITPFDTCR